MTINNISEQNVEDYVVNYLQQNPHFFIQRKNLFVDMQIPKEFLIEDTLSKRKVSVLNDENKQLHRKLDNLIKLVEANERLNQSVQRVVLNLIGINDANRFFDTLYAVLANEFHTDAVVLKLFEVPHGDLVKRIEFVEYDAQVFNLFENILEKNQAICGQLSLEQHNYLFSNHDNDIKIGSAALIPIGSPESRGLLVLGNKDVAHYNASMATDLLKYLGKFVTQMLKRWHLA
jgi:uncharacterized protein YigA (DUF484 family)